VTEPPEVPLTDELFIDIITNKSKNYGRNSLDTNYQFRFVFISRNYNLVNRIFYYRKTNPRKNWKEIVENKNIALAIIFGAFIIGISMIISAAIHG